MQKAFATDAAIEGNLGNLEPKLKLCKLSREELTHQMPKGAASDIAQSPVVQTLNQYISRLTTMRQQREEIVKSMTTAI